MAERTLETRYRVLAAAFADGPRGAVWKERGARDMREALDLLVHVLGKDLSIEPDVLDREHLHTMVTEILPGRLSGKEAYRSSILDLAEDLLLFIADEEGISKQWEWTSAVNESREAFDRALADDERPRFGVGPATPERRPGAKIGRNDPCPCGSGKKYKQCCLRLL